MMLFSAEATRHIDADTGNDRVTQFTLDWRQRVTEVSGELNRFVQRVYDNLRRAR